MNKIIIALTLLIFPTLFGNKQAIVIVPVANLIGQPAPKSSVTASYNNNVACGVHNRDIVCKRLHQILFQEQCTIVAERENQLQIALPSLFYLIGKDQKPHYLFWARKEDLCELTTLPAPEQKKLPKPIDFTSPQKRPSQTIASLIVPWKHENKTYSAGTRFVVHTHHPKTYGIYLLAPETKTMVSRELPRSIARLNTPRSRKKLIQDFIETLKQWAHASPGAIPYVWGGSSFTGSSDYRYALKSKAINGKKCCWYELNPSPTLLSGFDCSGLISRAAQINGIPFYYKNTHTIAQKMRTLQPSESIEAGDIIWIPGHVMVVADLEKNSLIEARGYDHGYGVVHEIPINKVFMGIETFDHLQKAYQAKKTIIRIDKKDKKREQYSNYKILKLSSVWE